MAEAKRDQNQVTTLLLTDDVTGLPVPALRDASGRLLCLATASGGGDVTGPASSNDNAIVRFDGLTGKIIQNSDAILDDSENLTGIGNITGKAGGIILTGGTGSADGLLITSTTDATKGVIQIGNTTSGVFINETAGQLNSGSGIPTINVFGFSANARIIAAKDNGTSAACFAAVSSGQNADLFGIRSNGTLAAPTAVVENDQLFQLSALGYDGTTHYPAAEISFEVDGTPASGDMPGRIVFSTTANGASSGTARIIIDSSGVLKPATNDGVALGTGALSFSDLFLATGGVINFANGDVTITHSSNALDIDGGVVDFGSTPTVNGSNIYFTGGTDVALADGGTGTSLTDPNADRIMFWDDSAGAVAWLTAGTGLTIADTTISATGSSTARYNMGIMMNIDNLQLSGTSPTNSTSINGVECAHAASLAANSVAIINYGSVSTDFNFYDRNPEMNLMMDIIAGDATGTGIYWFGDTAGTFPTITQTSKCMFVALNVAAGTGTWYLVNANGTTNTNTSMAGITATDTNHIRFVKDSTTNIKCYVNYTLKATSTTNLPSGDTAGGELVLFGTDNGAADSTARTARFGFVSILVDAPTG